MKFIRIDGLVVNADEIESITNDQGPAATLAFRSGQKIAVTDGVARKIIEFLDKNKQKRKGTLFAKKKGSSDPPVIDQLACFLSLSFFFFLFFFSFFSFFRLGCINSNCVL